MVRQFFSKLVCQHERRMAGWCNYNILLRFLRTRAPFPMWFTIASRSELHIVWKFRPWFERFVVGTGAGLVLEAVTQSKQLRDLMEEQVQRRICARHGVDYPCSCGMGNLYRFVEPV